MPYYEYRCRNEKCKYEQILKLPEPLTEKVLEEFYCQKCYSHMERKLSASFGILNGTEQPAKPAQTIDDKIIPMGKNTVFIGKKVGQSPPMPLPCGGFILINVYEGQIAKQTELN